MSCHSTFMVHSEPFTALFMQSSNTPAKPLKEVEKAEVGKQIFYKLPSVK